MSSGITSFLALVGIGAMVLYLRIPQRVDWQSLRGFKGADQVEQQAQQLLGSGAPSEPQSGPKILFEPEQKPSQPSPADCQQQLTGSDLGGASTVDPTCLKQPSNF